MATLWVPCLALAQAAAPPSVPSGPFHDTILAALKFLETVSTDAQSLSHTLAVGPGLLILSACVAIRIIMIALPMIVDKNGADVGPETVKLAVTLSIILAIMTQWTSGFNIFGHIWSGLDSLLNSVKQGTGMLGGANIPSSGDPLPAIAGWLFDMVVNTIKSDVNATLLFMDIPITQSGWHAFVSAITANNGLAIVAILLLILVALALVVVFSMMFFEMLMSWAHIIIALAFGPLVLAFYPIKPDWGKTIVTEVASGIMTFIATWFILLLGVRAVLQSSSAYITLASNYVTGTTGTGDTYSAVVAVGVYIFILVIIGYATSAAGKVAAALVGGKDHFGRHRGMGGALAGGAVGGALGYAAGAAKGVAKAIPPSKGGGNKGGGNKDGSGGGGSSKGGEGGGKGGSNTAKAVGAAASSFGKAAGTAAGAVGGAVAGAVGGAVAGAIAGTGRAVTNIARPTSSKTPGGGSNEKPPSGGGAGDGVSGD